MTGANAAPPPGTRPLKLVVWDLDETLWTGTLAEGDAPVLRPGIVDLVRALDERGVLQSIASRNDADSALDVLRSCGLHEYFLHPQIGWNAKSSSVRQIALTLNLGLDSVLFVDDQDFERAEVVHELPEVRAIPVEDAFSLLESDSILAAATEESRRRRSLYREEIARNCAEAEFTGPSGDFLATLDLALTLRDAGPADLARAEELVTRTNQLNSTGRLYTRDELLAMCDSSDCSLIVADLRDRFGDYGTIGLALLERGPACRTLKLLLISCRVMARGIAPIVVNYLLADAERAGLAFRTEYRSTGRNRAILIMLRFAGFREIESDGEFALLEHSGASIPPIPPYVAVHDQRS